MEWTWITVLEGFVSAAETPAALIAAGRRAGYQRSSNTIRCFAAAMDLSSAGLPPPSQLPHSLQIFLRGDQPAGAIWLNLISFVSHLSYQDRYDIISTRSRSGSCLFGLGCGPSPRLRVKRQHPRSHLSSTFLFALQQHNNLQHRESLGRRR